MRQFLYFVSLLFAGLAICTVVWLIAVALLGQMMAAVFVLLAVVLLSVVLNHLYKMTSGTSLWDQLTAGF